MAKDSKSFLLMTEFYFLACSRLSHSLIMSAVAFTTENEQFWDLLSALFIQFGILLLQKISVQLTGAYFSTVLWDQKFSMQLFDTFPGSFDLNFLTNDARFSEIASPTF